jgi:methylated-DNA-[protein]-cysteine S-methyltransferase
MVEGVRARHTRYEAPEWGVGDVWVSEGGVLLAHEIEFGPGAGRLAGAAPAAGLAAAPVADPPKGAASSPTGTLPSIRSPVGNGSETNVRRSRVVSGSRRSAAAVGDDLTVVEADDPAGRFVDLAQAFLAGEEVPFDDVEIDLAGATPFQLAVSDAIRSIPRGEVAGYGELAALAGYPRAGRAVGTFCARNRFMLVVPCHRVVGASGLGGYGSAGLGVKRRLLALEGVRL